jgi:hypothetical protein
MYPLIRRMRSSKEQTYCQNPPRFPLNFPRSSAGLSPPGPLRERLLPTAYGPDCLLPTAYNLIIDSITSVTACPSTQTAHVSGPFPPTGQ